MRMMMVAVGVFAADLAAVAAIVGSIFLERWLGLSRGLILDCIFVAAVSYGVAAWLAGMWIKREMLTSAPIAARANPGAGNALAEAARERLAHPF